MLSDVCSAEGDDSGDNVYYAMRREPHMMPEAKRRHGQRTNYAGSEVYLSFTDRDQAPIAHGLKSVSVDTLCTNRDLAFLIPKGGPTDFDMLASIPVETIKVLRGPTEPRPALAESAATWLLLRPATSSVVNDLVCVADSPVIAAIETALI